MFTSPENAMMLAALVSALNLPFGNAPATRSDRQKLEAVTLMIEAPEYAAEVYKLADLISEHLDYRVEWTVDSSQIFMAAGKRYNIATIQAALRLLGAGKKGDSQKLYATSAAIMPVTTIPATLFTSDE